MRRGGTTIPEKLREELKNDPEYSRCSLQGHGPCEGRITWEHALIYAGRKIQERFAIIPLCASHHNVDEFQDAKTMVKEKNIWVALNRATESELFRFSKVTDYWRERERLNKKYGLYSPPPIPDSIERVRSATIRKKPFGGNAIDMFEREVRAFAKMHGLSYPAARLALESVA